MLRQKAVNFFPVFIFSWSLAILAYADTVYFKDGGSIEGIIKGESDSAIQLDFGPGTMGFYKGQIERIERSNPEELLILRRQLKEKPPEPKTPLAKEISNKDQKPGEVGILQERGHIFINVLLNKKVNAKLGMDTGASYIMLSRKIGEKLGIDLSSNKDLMDIQVADGRKIMAKRVLLDSVGLRDKQAYNVEACIWLEDRPDMAFEDGVLGMSFLSRFNFKIDQKNKKLILEEIQ